MAACFSFLYSRIPFQVFKNLDSLVVVIRHIDQVVGVDEYAGGKPKLAVSVPGFSEGHQQPELPVEYLDVVEKAVHHIDIAITVHRNSPWPREIAGTVTGTAESSQKLPIGCEFLDPEIKGICCKNHTISVDKNMGGKVKLAFRLTAAAEFTFQFMVSEIKSKNIRTQGIDDQEFGCHFIYGDTGRPGEKSLADFAHKLLTRALKNFNDALL